MLSIDEAIAHAREVADENIKESIDTFPSLKSKNCIKCAEEHEQLAEWLEELKANRIALEKANGYLEANCRLGYSKGIDDFVKMAYEELLYSEGLTEIDIDYIAEQLKAGNSNGS